MPEPLCRLAHSIQQSGLLLLRVSSCPAQMVALSHQSLTTTGSHSGSKSSVSAHRLSASSHQSPSQPLQQRTAPRRVHRQHSRRLPRRRWHRQHHVHYQGAARVHGAKNKSNRHSTASDPAQQHRAPTRRVPQKSGPPATAHQPQGYWATYLVSAYCISGRTAVGTWTTWGTVAATLPFYTRLYIPGYGNGTVLDRGGAIGPGHLDIYMPNCNEALAWGIRVLNVEIFT
jgi:3D (Asp-Asp-Asp) domain-containing protein